MLDGFTARLQAVGREGALPALLLAILFSGELQNLISHGSGRALKISDLIISSALQVAVKFMCCQGDFAAAAVERWEKKPSWKGSCRGFASHSAGWLGLPARSQLYRCFPARPGWLE